MDVRSDLGFFSSSDRNLIEDVLRSIAQVRSIGKAWYVNDFDAYDAVIVVQFSKPSSRYTEIRLSLEEHFQDGLFRVVSKQKFQDEYGFSIEQCDGVVELADLNVFHCEFNL